MKALHFALIACAAASACVAAPEPAQQPPPPAEHWISLFNGQNLEGWTPKFAGHPLGENLNDTFRAENGVLAVRYDKWDGLEGRFGHLFYATPYSHYRIRLEYRFVGEQVAGAQAWALRNNGIMLHSQPPESMGLDQPFPTSAEVQLLGADGVNARTTANLCTPGMSVILNGERSETHCFTSAAPSPAPGEWASIEVEVQGGESIRHIVGGVAVMTYSAPLADEATAYYPDRIMSSGYIALQAESHPTEFRNIELLALE